MKLKGKKTCKAGCSFESSGRKSLKSELKPMLKKGNQMISSFYLGVAAGNFRGGNITLWQCDVIVSLKIGKTRKTGGLLNVNT